MLRRELMLWSALVFLFTGCPDEPKPPKQEVISGTQPKVCHDQEGNMTDCEKSKPPVVIHRDVGMNISVLLPTKKYAVSPEADFYYGQILFEPNILMQNLASNPQTQSFLEDIADVFHEHSENFGLAVTPFLDGQVLPDIILFNYAYNSKTKTWKTDINENPRTPVMLIKRGSELRVTFKYISITSRNFEFLKNLTRTFTSGRLLSTFTEPVVNQISAVVSSMLSNAQSATVTRSFVPVSDKVQSVKYFVKSKDGKNRLGEVRMSMILSNSMVSGTDVSDGNLNKIPFVLNPTNPLTVISTGVNRYDVLYNKLNNDVDLGSFFRSKNPDDFRDKCFEIHRKLDNYGLNLFDKLNALVHLLDRTRYARDLQLYDNVCLNAREKNILKDMGMPLQSRPIPLSVKIDIDNKKLDLIAGYLKSPQANVGHKSRLKSFFTKSILASFGEGVELEAFSELIGSDIPTPFSQEELLSHFSQIRTAVVTYYQHPKEGEHSFLFRTLDSEIIYRLTLKQSHQSGPVTFVKISLEERDRIPPFYYTRLMEPAKNKVEGFKDDTLLAQK